MDRKKIVMFGSFVADLTGVAEHLPKAGETVFGESFKIGPGGKGSNQTVAAHRAGADIKLITKLGDDLFGKVALDFYKENGISTDYLIVDEKEDTGIALICVDKQVGQNQILVVPAACTTFNDADMERIKPLIEGADYLLLQFEVNMDALEKAIDIAKAAGVKIVLNPAPARKVPQELLAKTDIVTPNEIEAETLTGVPVPDEAGAKKAAEVLHSWGISDVIITMGSSGVFASDGKNSRMVPAYKVDAIDTTGAGDAFNGGFVTALAEGKDIFEASEFGNALASLSVQKFGTAPSMPQRAEIDERFGR